MLIAKLPWTFEYDLDAGPIFNLLEPGMAHAKLLAQSRDREARELVRSHAEYLRKSTSLYEPLVRAVRFSLKALEKLAHSEDKWLALTACREVLEQVDDEEACPMCGFQITEVFNQFGDRRMHPDCFLEFTREQDEYAAERTMASEAESIDVQEESRELGLIPALDWRNP